MTKQLITAEDLIILFPDPVRREIFVTLIAHLLNLIYENSAYMIAGTYDE